MKPLLRAYLKKLFWRGIMVKNQQYRAVGKETGQTNPIERLNNTFR